MPGVWFFPKRAKLPQTPPAAGELRMLIGFRPIMVTWNDALIHANPCLAKRFDLPDRADLLAPAVRLVHVLTFALADGMTRMPPGASIGRTAFVPGHDMGGDTRLAALPGLPCLKIALPIGRTRLTGLDR